MIKIEDKLISDDVVEKQFACALEACKGACCWEGDFGAPLEEEELDILEQLFPYIKDNLSPLGRTAIELLGTAVYEKENQGWATPLLKDGACAYLTYDDKGFAKCGIEQAWEEGKIDFRKPISCHLYPIRIEKLPDYEAINYDRWDICSAACTKGERLGLPVYVFAKEALIRKYGEDFYEQLDATAAYLEEQKKNERS